MKLSRRDAVLLLILTILAIASAIITAMILLVRYNRSQIFRPAATGQPPSGLAVAPSYKYFSRLNGLGVLSEAEIAPKIVAVMINNNPEGYPTAGLNQASVVYEAPVEGSVTRFMAIYPESAGPGKVGPVRSARPYYLDWLDEYGTALYMHCGGSSDGLKEIKARGIFDADEFSRTPYYWRDRALLAPHNLFTSGEKWKKYLEDYSDRYEFRDWQGWAYGEQNATPTEKVSAASFAYGKKFVVGWRYDAVKGTYVRTLNGEDFLDDESQPVTADNVIFQFTTVKILDEIGRRNIAMTGEGEVRILRDGQMAKVIWKKEKTGDRTRFYDGAGAEINLKPGRTWVMIIPKNAALNLTN